MAGRFLYLSDENVWGPLLDGLEVRSYRLERATKLFGEHTDDLELLTYAARQGYVLVSSDKDMLAHAKDWLESGQKLHGLVFWEQHLQKIFSVGAFIRGFEALEEEPDPFAYPVYYLRPRP